MSAGIDCGAEVTGARSTMIAGRLTPGSGTGRCQLMPSVITAACAARMAAAEAPQRRSVARSAGSCRA
jgi:hypothetical protein